MDVSATGTPTDARLFEIKSLRDDGNAWVESVFAGTPPL